MLTTVEVSHAIKQDAKGNITKVRKALVALGLTVDDSLLAKEFSIDGAIKDVLNGIVVIATDL